MARRYLQEQSRSDEDEVLHSDAWRPDQLPAVLEQDSCEWTVRQEKHFNVLEKWMDQIMKARNS